MHDHAGYHFGDITRMVFRWLGPHTRAVRGKIDWLKFGKALVVAWIAGQTVDFGLVAVTLTDAVKDPQWAAALPAIVTVLVYVGEQGRRLMQDGKDAPPHPEPPHVQQEGPVPAR